MSNHNVKAISTRREWDVDDEFEAFESANSLTEEIELELYALNYAKSAFEAAEAAAKYSVDNTVMAPSQSAHADARLSGLGLASAAGKRQKIGSESGAPCLFQCQACNIKFSDSISYTEHLNSRLHQRRIGRSLVTSKVDAASIRQHLASFSQQESTPSSSSSSPTPSSSSSSNPSSSSSNPSDDSTSSDESNPSTLSHEMREELGFDSFGSTVTPKSKRLRSK